MAARKRKKKEEAPSAVDTARVAGAQYAQDQLNGSFFHDWVWDQMFEAEKMRKRDPNSVIPLESRADYDRLGRNMLQQLGWDIDRDLNPREVIGDASREEQKAFWDGLHDELRDPNVLKWLVEDLIVPYHEQVKGEPEQVPLPHVHERGRRRTRETPRTSIDWKPSGGGTGWSGKGPSGQAYLLRKAGDEKWNLHIDGQRHGPYAHLDWAKAEAERNERMRRSGGHADPQTWAEPRLRERHGVQDYVAVDTRNRVVAGPFKDYAPAKSAADKAGGHVRFVMDRGPVRAVHEDPRDQGYDPDSKAGPRNFPSLHRVPSRRSR